MKDKEIIRPLVDELLALAGEPRQQALKVMWAEHQALRKTDKIPICVYYEGIPHTQWRLMLGDDLGSRATAPAARRIELDLRQRLWIARNVPDDHIVWPTVTIAARMARSEDWGVPFGLTGSDNPEDARRMSPAFPERIDVSRLKFADMEVDSAATAAAIAEAKELVEGRLQVLVRYPNLGFSPFDLAVEMRGMEAILMDAVEAPELITELMEYITGCFERHHRRREENGWINCHAFPADCGAGVPPARKMWGAYGWRIHCAYMADDFNPAAPRLRDEWAYVSAQSSSGLSPTMYAELVHPYNQRMAAMFPNQTVYYHGCERLDLKLDILATLPNLRRFHVSPWSSVAAAAAKFGGKAVLEVHAHPGKVFFGFTRKDMKDEIAGLVAGADGASLDLNISDIHSINGDPSLLTSWAEAAQEIAGER